MSLVDKKISINKDISIAKTMPSKFYLNDNFFNQTIDKIFKNSWQFITHKKLIKHNITPFYFLRDTINEPLIISKNNNSIKCLTNVCTHRANILCNNPSNNKSIQCNYHGRTFDLDGKIKNMPGFEGVKNFPSKNDNLINLKLFDWNNFLFCSLYGSINIKDVLDDISKRLIKFPFKKLIFNEESSNTYILNTHWALYCENYLEGFHVPYLHKGLNNDINFETYQTEIMKNGVLQYANEKNNDIYAYYYWIFPNMMLNFYHWGLSINIVEPINKKKTKIRFLSFVIDGLKQPTNTTSSLDTVEKEDQNIVKQVQKGIKSEFYNQGRYSLKHEVGVHHFHRLLARAIQ